MELTVEKRARTKKINAPFGYFGSKNKIALQLCTHLPPHHCWVEAFCGSASLTLRKTQAPIEIINDIDDEIINFFEQLRDHPDALRKAIELTPYAEKELSEARLSDRANKIERARCFTVQSMMAINGSFGDAKGGFSYSDSYARNGKEARVNRWNNLPERLLPVIKRLKDVRIEHKDARKILTRFINRPATLVYMDPPYLADRAHGYNNEANNEEFHTELLELANKSKCMVFISGYENELYDSMLLEKRGWDKKTIETSTKDVKGNVSSRTEVVWMNKYFTQALKENKILVTLTKKEKDQNKLNPERL